MAAPPAYRIDVASVPELSAFLAGFRADATRLHERMYLRAVALTASAYVDDHRTGVASCGPEESPLRDAIAEVRRLFDETWGEPPRRVDFDCELRVYFHKDLILARFAFGNDDFRKSFETRRNVRAWGWSPQAKRPQKVSPTEWKERESAWTQVDADRLGDGLSLRLVEKTLPAAKWTDVRKAMPSWEARVRRATKASAFLSRPESIADGDLASFNEWLRTREGEAAYDLCRKRVERIIPEEIGRNELARYGRGRPSRTEPPKEEPPAAIDHADIIESGEGRIFIAVMYAGLSANERLYVQVSDGQITFSQGGVTFGAVTDVSHAAIDLLRGVDEAVVVEIRRFGDRREVKAKHMAMVRNTSISDQVDASLTRWTRNASDATTKEETWAG